MGVAIFNPTSLPRRSGVFANVRTVPLPTPRAGASGTVGLIVQADWGPANEIVELTDAGSALATYGTGGTAYFAIQQALQGEGVSGRSGASVVKAYRIAGSSANEAAVTLDNTDDPAANALTLTAKYPGARANSFKIVTATDAGDASKRDLTIYEGTIPLETYVYSATGGTLLADLATNINARSRFVTATVVEDGFPLAAQSAATLTLGDSGTTTSTNDHTAAQSAFEADATFSVFALDDFDSLTSDLKTQYRDWAVRLVEQGVLFHIVIGGAASELPATATARSVTMDTPDATHTLGEGDVIVNTTGDLVIGGTSYSSSKMAPRLAGILASADYFRSISGATLADATIASPPSPATIEQLVAGGVIPYVTEGGVVRVQRGVTAYGQALVPSGDKGTDYESLIFKTRLWQVLREVDDLFNNRLRGKQVSNTPRQRETIVGMFQALLNTLADPREVIDPGPTVALDDTQDNTKEAIHLIIVCRPAGAIEQVFITMNIPT